jgi:hypothetical protein
MNAIAQPIPPVVGNKLDMAALLAKAQELGEQAGKGKDTQIKFLLSACEGGYLNAIDLVPNKHGTEIDDATKLAETYVRAQGTATVFDAKAGNQRKLVSTLRTSIKLGQWPKGGSGEPMATVNNLMSHRQTLRKQPQNAKKLDDAANTFLRYARAQLKKDTLIDGEELKNFVWKKVPDGQNVSEVLESVRNTLNKLVKGGRKDGLQDASSEVRAAAQKITDRLVAIAKAGQTASQP